MRELILENVVDRIDKLAKINGENRQYLAENVLFKQRQVFTDAKSHPITTVDLCKLSAHFGVSVDYLLFGDDSSFLQEDLANCFSRLSKMTPEHRAPIIAMIEGQIDYWSKIFNADKTPEK